jgi:hypothetical protein
MVCSFNNCISVGGKLNPLKFVFLCKMIVTRMTVSKDVYKLNKVIWFIMDCLWFYDTVKPVLHFTMWFDWSLNYIQSKLYTKATWRRYLMGFIESGLYYQLLCSIKLMNDCWQRMYYLIQRWPLAQVLL